ncbi:hypothetical protein [Kribbella sp. NPDC004875]|uniref:hypothetical protein n=1 Tax=Kribbella sp. NPDC004875 TaxID=3364107 RepID=UPI00368AC5D0
MVDLSDSPAMKTVEFGRAITGRQLVDAVEKACEQAGGGAYKEKVLNEDVMYLVGRRGWNDCDNLLVTPDKTTATIDPAASYTSAVVVRHDQPVKGRMYDESGPYTRDQEIRSVVDFSEHLAQAVAQQPEPALQKGLAPNALTGVTRPVQDPVAGSRSESSAWSPQRDGNPTRFGRGDGSQTR